MSKLTIEEAFKAEGLDANAITVNGIPERHAEAVIAIAKLFVGADHADGDGILDYKNYSQSKFSAIADMGSPSGAGVRTATTFTGARARVSAPAFLSRSARQLKISLKKTWIFSSRSWSTKEN